MSSQNQIVCIGFWSEYDRLFIENAQLDDCKVTVIDPNERLAKFIPPSLLLKPLRTILLKLVARHLLLSNKQGHILIHDERIMTNALLSVREKLNAQVLMRNVLGDNNKVSKSILALQQNRYPIWSFDTADCARHGFLLYRQFVSKIGSYEHTPIKLDFVFLGKDKGRKSILDSLQQQLEEMGYRCDIDLRVGARKKGTGLVDKSYHAYLTQICTAKCIIDIVQGEQSGLTLRPLEAVIYQRKLLTNNILVRELPFYHPDNVFIIGQDSYDRLANFMMTSFVEPPDPEIQPYRTKSMLQQILSGQTISDKRES